jgi:hypothetical protein
VGTLEDGHAEALERSTRRRILEICESDIAFQVFPDILKKYS